MKKSDIVQITDENHHWFPCLVIVDEIKSFGIQGYTTIPDNDREKENGNAYIRLNINQYEVVGTAVIIAP